jgi:hypothetical protein
MTAFHIIQIAIGSAVFIGAVLALNAEERCGQCLKLIYFGSRVPSTEQERGGAGFIPGAIISRH